MFVRCKKNRSGTTSVVVVDKSSGHFKEVTTIGVYDFRLAMFLDSVDRLIYFRNKKTREKISLVELASGI